MNINQKKKHVDKKLKYIYLNTYICIYYQITVAVTQS